jgi:hypothetical protein
MKKFFKAAFPKTFLFILVILLILPLLSTGCLPHERHYRNNHDRPPKDAHRIERPERDDHRKERPPQDNHRRESHQSSRPQDQSRPDKR